MINDGQVYLAGHVASPPSFKFVGGKPAATVRVAFTPRWISRDTGEWADGPTSFVNVLCWRSLAGNVAVSLRKGEPVLVMGRLRVRRYPDKEGAMKLAVEVEAHSIGHDLTRGVAAFSRTRRAAGETALEAAGALMNGGTAPGAAQAGGARDEQRDDGWDGQRDDERDGQRDERRDDERDGLRDEQWDGLRGPVRADGAVSDAEADPDAEAVADEDEEGLDGELDESVVARFSREAAGPLGAVAPV